MAHPVLWIYSMFFRFDTDSKVKLQLVFFVPNAGMVEVKKT